MFNQVSKTHASFDAKGYKSFVMNRDYAMDDVQDLLPMIGVGFKPRDVRAMQDFYAMDSIQQPVTDPSIPGLWQFLQNWLPGVVEITTAARKIDELIGSSTIGSWEDESIVQQVLENTGTPSPYGDTTVIPLANWNMNFVDRTVVRFEQGFRSGPLEEARSARVRIDSAGQKRTSAALQLEIQRNQLGFYGYNNGANKTYGFLNDPNLPNYQTVATVGGNTTWATKSFLAIQGDLLTALQTLRTQSKEIISPDSTPITLAVATNCVDYLAKTSDFGISVYAWLKQFYPNVRVVSAPQLNAANGGANAFYLFADSVDDGVSSDDRRTFVQVVPARFQLLGVAKLAKGFEEDYSNASAGSMCKRPYAVYRASGI